jgi:hypothetical protein
MARKVSLVRVEEPTLTQIYAEIADNGDLLLSGQDIGEAVEAAFYHSDYEYFLRIPAANKDDVLLALIQTQYSGNTHVISELKQYLESRSVPCEFETWP